jgi:hypothetical protein
MHLNRRIVNLSTPLPRFRVLLLHERLDRDGGLKVDPEETKDPPQEMAFRTIEGSIIKHLFFIDFSTLFSNIVLYIP